MASFCSCDGCGREFRVKWLKRGLCRSCNLHESDDIDAELHVEISTPAEDHDARYHGEEIPDVEID